MKLIPTDAMCHIPWKSGGGVTTEIAITPAGATLDHFDWCVSTAQVGAAGPFSRFTGIDRLLAVITGGRLAVHRAEAEVVTPMPSGTLARFPDEANVHATLDAPLSDFNVMTRYGAWTYRAEAIVLAADEHRSLPRLYVGMWQLVCYVYGVLSINVDDVPQGAAAQLDAEGDSGTVIAHIGSAGHLAALWPVG